MKRRQFNELFNYEILIEDYNLSVVIIGTPLYCTQVHE